MNAFHNHSFGLTNQSSHFVPGDQFEKLAILKPIRSHVRHAQWSLRIVQKVWNGMYLVITEGFDLN